MHQFGGPGNGNFVQGDMNYFGVVYMSTVGRGLIVGAPEGTEFVDGLKRVNVSVSTYMQLEKRTLYVSAPAGSVLKVFAANGRMAFKTEVGTNSAVSLSRLPMGRYIVQLESPAGRTLNRRGVMIR
jgi:hypothetical protein